MRYIYPKAKAQAKRRVHPMVLIAAMSLTLFSLVGTASVLGLKPFAQLNQPVAETKYGCSHKLIGKRDTSTSGVKSPFDSNMPSIESDDSDDVFNTPIVRA